MRPGPWQHSAAAFGSLLLWSLSLRSPRHKDFFPLDGSDYLGFVLAIGSLLVAAGGGIGGGALLVPIFIIIFGAPRPSTSAVRFSCLLVRYAA